MLYNDFPRNFQNDSLDAYRDAYRSFGSLSCVIVMRSDAIAIDIYILCGDVAVVLCVVKSKQIRQIGRILLFSGEI